MENIFIKGYKWIKSKRISILTSRLLKKHGVKSKPIFSGMPKLFVSHLSTIIIGENFICRSTPEFAIGNSCCSKIDVRNGAKLIIGDNVGVSNTVIQCHHYIRIGDNVNIGDGTLIMDTDFHSLKWEERADRNIDTTKKKKAPVIIGNNVFIGARSIICKGVSVGDRSIIAAGSVVVKDIPNDCVAGGNPCKIIRSMDYIN